jgi:S1-C subfamily serine protease
MSENPSPEPRTVAVARHDRRLLTWITALAVVTMVAFVSFRTADADNGQAGQQEYKVSLVSQIATEEPATAPETESSSVADVAEKANAAVVTVYTFVEGGASGEQFPPLDPSDPDEGSLKPGDESGDEQAPLGAGSGWIYTEDGYVVTNAHVVAGADSFVVQYFDGTQVEAELVGTDPFQDVAVLKLNLEEGETVPGVSVVGDSSELRAGDEVVAIGSPLGEFTNSVSDGNIGGLDRSLDAGNGTSLDNLIQHDAEISPGNSGGPLLNMDGEVIGMNVAKVETASTNGATASGLNFAIDGNTVAGIADQIISNNGSVEFPYIGIQTEMTEQGQVVVAVEPDGPAADAGLQEGDILTGIDGVSVDDENSFMQLLLDREPGETVSITVERAGSTEEVSVTLGVRPDGI